jgi:hypothetical protein
MKTINFNESEIAFVSASYPNARTPTIQYIAKLDFIHSNLYLKVGVYKSNGIVVNLSCFSRTGDYFETFLMFTDLNRTFKRIPCGRVTFKALEKVFDSISEEDLLSMLQIAKDHYTNVGTAHIKAN